MSMFDNQMGLRFAGCALGMSARRIREHTQLRQVNPFPLVTRDSALKPQNYVDIVDASGLVVTLTGFTLSDLLTGKHGDLPPPLVSQLLAQAKAEPARLWLARLKQHLLAFCDRHAMRNLPQAFLPAGVSGPFAVPGLKSALITWLDAHRTEKANPDQWLHRISNLSKKGLRAEELESSSMAQSLSETTETSITGDTVLNRVRFDALRLSIRPVVRTMDTALTFFKIPSNATVKRIKPKLKAGLTSHPQWRDRVLGYWVDTVVWDDLLGHVQRWMAFTHRGQPIVSHDNTSGLCATPEEAWTLANIHARKAFPKLTAKGRWSRYRLTGGEQYREWLVTLPYYAPTYFTSHFVHRNVLLHVRCDMREDVDGGRVLVLHEVQSDWAQQARRALKTGNGSSEPIPIPPWLQEWPALALKLILLHAAQRGAVALAWTRGDVQVKRYRGLGAAGLLELYDRTLPAEAARILRPFGKQCESIDVFMPVNFFIEPADIGYEVFDEHGDLLGTATSWAEAQRLLPDGAHEWLMPMRGIRLDEALREALLTNGFYAWGTGIQ